MPRRSQLDLSGLVARMGKPVVGGGGRGAGGGGRGAGRVAKTSLLMERFVTPAKGDTEKRSKRLCFS